jgi:hypothetical protein
VPFDEAKFDLYPSASYLPNSCGAGGPDHWSRLAAAPWYRSPPLNEPGAKVADLSTQNFLAKLKVLNRTESGILLMTMRL